MKKKASKTGKQTSSQVQLRPPIVTVLGHVDHGKTTLLDAIRKTKVAGTEAGGITQSIGASVFKTDEGRQITFIDTPGHAAFSKMRSRGAKVADIAILVVSSVDGVKPQTMEALSYVRQAKIPFIVVASKTDLSTADINKIKSQLEKEGVSFEGKGGDVPFVSVSGKSGKGVKELLEMINLVAEVNEIKGDPKGTLEGAVIETSKDKRGLLVSCVLTNGTLKAGEDIAADGVNTRVRGLFDELGKQTKVIGPGKPALILGFSRLPPVGAKLVSQDVSKIYEEKEKRTVPKEADEGKIPIVVKANSSGALEDLLANLPDEVVVIYADVGDIREGDVFMAKSAIPARIFAFGSKVPTSVSKLAVTEGVEIETFDVIYELFKRLKELIEEDKAEVLGKAEVIQTFPYDDKKVAGCKVLSGRIARPDKLVIMRGSDELGEVKITSMKKEKQKIEKAEIGEEFGLIFKPQLDFKVGDMILSVRRDRDKE